MPSKSKKQQRFMALVQICQDTGNCPNKKVSDAAKSMTKKEVRDFAKTKHTDLPEKIKSESSKSRRIKKVLKSVANISEHSNYSHKSAIRTFYVRKVI